jgi:hypothetical protein
VRERTKGPSSSAAAGATAAIVVDIFTYPLTVCFTRLTADMAQEGQAREFNNLWDCMKKTGRAEGLLGLYRGMGISLCGIIPFYAISFPLNDVLKKKLPMDENAIPTKLLAGGLAAIMTMFLVYPTDTIRRRLAIAGTKGFAKSQGTIHCIKHMYNENGAKGFYKGMSLNALKVAPQMAIQFLVYDKLKVWVNDSEVVKEYGLAKLK